MRRRGTGTIERARDGGFYPRLPGNGGRLPWCATEDDAALALELTLSSIETGAAVAPAAETLHAFGIEVLDQREAHGIRGIATERSRWRTHVEKSEIGALALDVIAPADIIAFRDELLGKRVTAGKGYKRAADRRLSRSTVQSTLNLVRAVLAVAKDRSFIASNPADGVRLPRSAGRAFEPWTYLLPDEQSALLTAEKIPIERRAMIAFALGTGLREGELYNLELADVHRDHVVIRFGSQGRAPKSGKIRRVDLFGIAAAALAEWLPRLAAFTNPHGLLFPLPRGSRRQKGAPKWWASALSAAGLVAEKRHDRQRVRWHDLRHSCASSLVAGWWGRRWALHEVRDLLGHSSVTVTERYAHLAASALRDAARATSGELVGRSTDENQSRFRDLNSRPTVYEGEGKPSNVVRLSQFLGRPRGDVATEAAEALEAIRAGGPDAYRRAVEVLEGIAARAGVANDEGVA